MVTGTVSCLQGDYLRKQVVKALSGLIVGGTMLVFDMHLFFRIFQERSALSLPSMSYSYVYADAAPKRFFLVTLIFEWC